MKHVVVIGLDSACWDILNKLVSRGVMKKVNAFKDEGTYGDLKSIIPPFTVPTWASLSSGVNPGKHGAYAFVMPTEDYNTKLMNPRNVKYPKIYEILSMRGLSSVVINLPLSYPPVIFKGVMVSDWLYPKLKVFPEKAGDLIKDYVPLDPSWGRASPLAYVKNILTGLEGRLRTIKRLFLGVEWTLFFVVFSEIDFLLHKMYDDIVSDKGLAGEAYKVFGMIDNFIGWVFKNTPPETLVVLVSDHGSKKCEKVVRVNKILLDAGLIKFKTVKREAPPLKKQEYPSFMRARASKRRIIRVPKFLYSLVTKVELMKRARRLMFRSLFGRNAIPSYSVTLDGPSCFAYMFHVGHFGIYVNSKDNFKNGLVEGKEAGTITSFIMNRLLSVKDPKTHEEVFERVCKREELFQGPCVKNFPHIVFLPKKGYWIDGGVRGKIIEEKPQGMHSLMGIFGAWGEEVKSGIKLDGISIFDVVPTILHYLNFSVPHDADGKVLLEIFKEESETRERPVKKANYLERWNIIRKVKSLSLRR